VIDEFTRVVVNDYIRVEMNRLADELASGRVRSMEDYRYTCGVLRGLAMAEEYIINLAKRAEEAE
jgi:hypothetical protein